MNIYILQVRKNY